MNYSETLDFLFSKLPMYQRIGAAAYKADLNNTIALCNLLDNPQNYFKSIHIAGTNGKGSVSHYLAAILQSAGYKTGLYTSPHLKDFRERIKINGANIPEKEVVEFTEFLKPMLEENKLEPSFFEMTVSLAFHYFAKEEIDIAIIETGLGGRLDSTNVITPMLSIITNISRDHTALLGDTLPIIAVEKAGIIKQKIPLIIGEENDESREVFISKCIELQSRYTFAERIYNTKNATYTMGETTLLTMDITRNGNVVYSNLQSGLAGMYQQKNIPPVLCAVDELRRQDFYITETNVRNGMKNVVKSTEFLGRWQVLNQTPLTIADTGHNEAGIKLVIEQLNQTPHNTLHFVLGMVNDKDISSILQSLPAEAVYYFCKANIPRGLDARELQIKAAGFNLRGEVYTSVRSAFEAATKAALADDLVFIGGSTFTVAEVV